jgi:hypothetical protein
MPDMELPRPMNKKSYIVEIAFTGAAVVAFVVWLIPYLQLDFWYDEIFTLQYYVFVPIKKILTDYSVPNNHILFNIFNHVFIRIFSIQNISVVLSHPIWLRALMGIYVIITLVYLYRLAAKFFNSIIAAAAIIILLTTVPYYNFALQLRGYSLSMALSAMLLFYAWSYAQTPRWRFGMMLVLSGSLLLYTIPSNLYLVASLLLLYGVSGIAHGVSSWHVSGNAPWSEKASGLIRKALRDSSIQTACLLALSGTVVLLLYLPVLPVMFQQTGTVSGSGPNLNTLIHLLPKSLEYYFSLRFVLIPMGVFGMVVFILQLKKHRDGCISHFGLICLYLFFCPFILSALRGDTPFDRTFIYETLIFSLFIAAASYQLIHFLPVADRLKLPIFLLALLLFCQFGFAAALGDRNQRVLYDLTTENKSQDIFYNYFQAHYSPLQMAVEVSQRKDQWPVYVYQANDPISALAYLRIYNIDYQDLHTLADLIFNSSGKGLVMTSTPARFQSLIAEDSTLRCDPLNTDDFFVVFSCQRMSR